MADLSRQAALPTFLPPARDCPLCPRLAAFRGENREAFPGFWNGAVPSFGGVDAQLLIVGLAPGLKGANFSARPFTGDYAGDLLYPTLLRYGFAEGAYHARSDDGLRLKNSRITNAVRCVPPQNKPLGEEVKQCGQFLRAELAAMTHLKIILALGGVSHGAVLAALGVKKSAFRFQHGAVHELPEGLVLTDSYHCSRYNVNTGRLTAEMFEDVVEAIAARLGG